MKRPPKSIEGRELAFSQIVARGDTKRAPSDLLIGEFRQSGQRPAGAAEPVDERVKRPRPDVLAAGELQPVETLRVRKTDLSFLAPVVHGLAPIFVSVPSISREILGQCLNHSSTASATNSSAGCGRPIAQSAIGVAGARPPAQPRTCLRVVKASAEPDHGEDQRRQARPDRAHSPETSRHPCRR